MSRTLQPNGKLLDDQGNVTPAFLQVWTLWGDFVTAGKQSGVTADRPTQGLWVGRTYFDTTLNKPVWVKTATGTPVWVDATGAVV